MNDPSPLWDSTLERYVLQEVIFNSRAVALAPKLYMSELLGPIHRQAGRLALPAGAKVGFNTYANSFFASYWEKYTDLRVISLSGKLQGRGLLHLFHSTPTGQTIKVGEYPVEDLFHIHFDLFSYLPDDGASGRFFFDLEAVTDVAVERIAFSTFPPPHRAVSFSLGVCTYRKEQHVTNLVLGLEDYVKRGGTALSEVIVVNNSGDNADLPVLQILAERMPGFTLIAQDNIGGAGGFARTLHESLKSETSTHHIFMDDDVFLDTHMLDRLRAFVSYCLGPHVVGGQMMNMSAPCMLYEGGARLDYWGFLEQVGSEIDGTRGDEVSFFDQVREVDYNAWWFACVPKAEAARAGLPLNIFIRGDDFEYGLRLGKAGISTVSLPGLFIWHEAFDNKSSAWLEYYNWRNRLIVAAIHNDPERMDIPPADVLRDAFAEALKNERAQYVLARALAVFSFLRGPEAVLSTHAGEFHTELQQSIAGVGEDPDAVATRISEELTAMGKPLEGHPFLRLRHSARLGRFRRDAQTAPWIDRSIADILEAVLACYATDAPAAVASWKNKAHELALQQNWTTIYGWEA